jgi:hypothetical protein
MKRNRLVKWSYGWCPRETLPRIRVLKEDPLKKYIFAFSAMALILLVAVVYGYLSLGMGAGAFISTSAGENSSEENPPPPQIVEMAKEYVASKVGVEYFNTYFRLEGGRFIPVSARGEGNPNEVYMVGFIYRISVGNYLANVTVGVFLDTEGRVTRTEGVPIKEYLMPFRIDREEAIRIAKEAGLPEGIKGYSAHISYDLEGAYMWDVTVWFSEPRTSLNDHGPGRGRSVDIDVNSGEAQGSVDILLFADPPSP